MNQRNNAEQMLGLAANAKLEEISKAFQAKVSELSRKQITPNEFQKQLKQMYNAYELLTSQTTKTEQEQTVREPATKPVTKQVGASFKDIFEPFKQMQHEMNELFNKHMFKFPMLDFGGSTFDIPENPTEQTPNQPYKYVRSFSKSLKIDKDGNVVGSSNKIIQNNDKVFKEEKNFDSVSNKIHIKRYKPDGTIKEFDKPYFSNLIQ
jgi:YD repeat-containing protein